MVVVVGTLITTGGDEIPLREDSASNGTEFSLNTDSNVTTVATDIGSYKPGTTITHGFITATNNVSYAYVLRQGVVLSIIPVAAAGVQGELLPLSTPVTLRPGDDVRVLPVAAASRNAALCVKTNTGMSRIFVVTPSGGATNELVDLQNSANGIGDTLQGMTVTMASFSSVDGIKLVSGGGAWIRNPSGQVVGAIPATNVSKAPVQMSKCSIPIALNFEAQCITSS